MPKFPEERWRTCFYFDQARTAREAQQIIRSGLRIDSDGNFPLVTREISGFSWFTIKVTLREVRGLKTDWDSYILGMMDTWFNYYKLPHGVLNNARLSLVRRKRVRRVRQGYWPLPQIP